MRVVIFCIAAGLYPIFSYGTQEFSASWNEVSVVATVEGVAVRAEAKAEKDRITHISLHVKGRQIVVPSSEYSGLTYPHLNTFQITYIPTDGKEPWAVGIDILYGDPAGITDKSELNIATFGFSETAYSQRWTRERISSDTWQHYRKLPGQPIETMGRERMIGSVK
jgi:hypothetical protein